MKFKTVFLLRFVFSLCFTACGEEAKRPVDYPNTAWACTDGEINFSVADNGTVENASLLNKNGDTVKVKIVFSEASEKKASFYSEDGKELYFSGTCSYGESSFTLTVSDIYNSDFSYLPPMLTFKTK